MKYFSSDFHIGHENVIKFSNRPFKDVEEMDKKIVDMVLDTVKKGDEIFFLGDLGFHPSPAIDRLFRELPKKVNFNWIIGNHDKKVLNHYKQFTNKLDFIMETHITTEIGKQRIVMCHYPMLTWNQSFRGAWQLFGHHHANGHEKNLLPNILTGKMFNVNLEFNDYKMYDENDLIRIMNKKPNNWDLLKDLT